MYVHRFILLNDISFTFIIPSCETLALFVIRFLFDTINTHKTL